VESLRRISRLLLSATSLVVVLGSAGAVARLRAGAIPPAQAQMRVTPIINYHVVERTGIPLRERFWFLRGIRRRTRTARFQTFKTYVQELRAASADSDRVLRVLDLGGTRMFWEQWWKISEQDRLHVTLLNDYKLEEAERTQGGTRLIENICRDATTLTNAELHNYDIIFANSFLEHLRTRDDQKKLADAIMASGLPFFIQVPNKYSPVDPHRPYAPFFAIYPSFIRSRYGPGPKTTLMNGRRWRMDYNPLGLRDMQALFPTATFKVEKPFGIPMSILAFRASSSAKAVMA